MSNGMTVMLIEDCDTRKSAAAIDFGVGSWNDIYDEENKLGTLGLAHFHEHMVFMGTKEYPGEDVYDKKLARFHGSGEADTSDQDTNFRLSVNNEGLDMALKMFASQFKEPLFRQESIDKEVHQVHSEFMEDKPREQERQFEMFKVAANSDHPFHYFDIGNMDTLNIPDVRKYLKEFDEKYFSSHNAKLVVYGSEKLDKLQDMVEGAFNGIKSFDSSPPEVNKSAYTESEWKKNYVVETANNKETLCLVWEIPTLSKHNRVPLMDLLINLFEYKGPNSLFDVLLRKGLISHIKFQESVRDRSLSVVSVILVLTEKGVWKTPEIVKTVIQFIRLIMDEGLTNWRFEEYTELDEVAWRYYRRPDDLVEFIRDISLKMHFSDAKDMLYPTFRCPPERYVWDKNLFSKVLSAMAPEKMISFLFTGEKNFSSNMQTEEYFKINYMVDEITDEHIEDWNRKEVHPELKLPRPNPWMMNKFVNVTKHFPVGLCGIKFLPNTGKVMLVKPDGPAEERQVLEGWVILTINDEPFTEERMHAAKSVAKNITFRAPQFVVKDKESQLFPELLFGDEDDPLQGWLAYETRNHVPRIFVSMEFRNPSIKSEVDVLVKAKLFELICKYKFDRDFGQAEDGGYHLDAMVDNSEFEMYFEGYHHHMTDLVRDYLHSVFNQTHVPDTVFRALKANLRATLKNENEGLARHQTWRRLLQLVQAEGELEAKEELAALEKIDQDGVSEFVGKLQADVEVTFFVYGSANKKILDTIGRALEDVVSAKNSNSTDSESYVSGVDDDSTTHRVIPHGVQVIQMVNEREVDENYCADVVWQVTPGPSNHDYYSDKAKMEFILTMMRQKVFDELRTKQQLGYTAGNVIENYGFTIYSRIYVMGPAYDAGTIFDRIMKFVKWFYEEHLKKLDVSQFETMRRSLKNKYTTNDQTLKQQNAEYWMDIKAGATSFDSDDRMTTAIDELYLDAVQDFFHNRYLDPENRRVLGILLYPQKTELKAPQSNHTMLHNLTAFDEEDWVEEVAVSSGKDIHWEDYMYL